MNRALNLLRTAAVIVILAILVKLALLRIDRGDDIHKPQGYERIAQVFLRHGWITIDDQWQGGARGRPPAKARRACIDVRFSSAMSRSSTAARTGSSASRISRSASVDTTRHNVLLPYSVIESWRGSLRYRGNRTLEGSLRGIGVDIRLDPLTRNLFDQVAARGSGHPRELAARAAESRARRGGEHLWPAARLSRQSPSRRRQDRRQQPQAAGHGLDVGER